jgi:hypothetical protein
VKKYILIFDTGNVYKYEIDTDNLPEWLSKLTYKQETYELSPE